MDPGKLFFDKRLGSGCTHCGAAPMSRDHIPSKIFLDSPLPNNLPVVKSCVACNSGFSLDEEYVSCFIECAKLGTTIPSEIEREKIKRILTAKPALRQEIQNSLTVSNSGDKRWLPNLQRVENVLLKLARGHAMYECAEACDDQPSVLSVMPLCSMTASQVATFEQMPDCNIWPEIGSRAFLRASGVLTDHPVINDWHLIQDGLYRYSIDYSGSMTIKIVIREYLACEISWD